MFEGLIFACPFGSEEGKCPFMEIRKMNLIEKVSHYKTMDSEVKAGLIHKHKICLNRRENVFWEINVNPL